MISSERALSVLRGHGEVRSQPASDWTGPMPLPSELERYYREIGPADITIDDLGDPFFLPALAGLWNFQAGYRWPGSSGEALSAWEDDWLVVADQGGDPLIFSRQTGRILLAHHGAGAWEPVEVFSDLSEMACSLSLLGSVVAESDVELLDDDGNFDPEYRRAAEFGLTDLLGSADRAVHVLALLGWG
jgi:hypothetical protein